MFKALDFQYDGKSSTDFYLKLVNFGDSGNKSDSIGIPLEVEDEKIKRIDKPFFYGVEAKPSLTFKIQIVYLPPNQTQERITRQSMGAIIKWLCQREYKEFKIIDSDYTNIIYNCIIQNPKQIEVGNVPFGLEFDVLCDRPYAFHRKTITKSVSGTTTFNILNVGFDNNYIYPEVEFSLTGANTNFNIVNNTDSGRVFAFTGLSLNETVYVDCQRQEIVSSTGLNRNSNFNFNWFRLTSSYNNSITINGNANVTFRIEFPMPV